MVRAFTWSARWQMASGRRRSQVSVEFELLDDGGQKVEVARAFRPVLEPGAKWEVKLPVASGAEGATSD